jgi:hypothetical protein
MLSIFRSNYRFPDVRKTITLNNHFIYIFIGFSSQELEVYFRCDVMYFLT